MLLRYYLNSNWCWLSLVTNQATLTKSKQAVSSNMTSKFNDHLKSFSFISHMMEVEAIILNSNLPSTVPESKWALCAHPSCPGLWQAPAVLRVAPEEDGHHDRQWRWLPLEPCVLDAPLSLCKKVKSSKSSSSSPEKPSLHTMVTTCKIIFNDWPCWFQLAWRQTIKGFVYFLSILFKFTQMCKRENHGLSSSVVQQLKYMLWSSSTKILINQQTH